MRILGLILTP